MANKEPRIERGIAKLIIPHKKGELVAAWPSKGPNTYKNVGKEILNDKNNLRVQTGYETALFANKSYGRKEPEFQDVRDKIDKRYLHVYQVNFWLPENDKNSGMYSIYDANALGRDIEFNQEELEEKLRGAEGYRGVRINRDSGVAFAPRSKIYLGKETDWNKFKINGKNIAIFSPEGAEELAELGKNHFGYGYCWGVIGNQEVKKTLSALYRFWYFDGWLYVDGDYWDCGGVGHAFGVCKDSQSEQ